MVINGSCLCGAVKYELEGDPVNTAMCYCNNCRKASGSVGMANSFYRKEAMKILQGNDKLRTYHDTGPDSGATIERSFCSGCGSPVVGENKTQLPGVVVVAYGTMELSPEQKWEPRAEYFCKRKASWFQTPEGTEKFSEL